MAGVSDRFVLLGTTEHPHEKEALDFVRDCFPDSDPMHARGLVDLQDRGSGRLYEIDLIVIGYWAIYLVEIKSHPGRIEGDDQGWMWTPPGETRARYMDNPLRLTNHKCKVLKGLLDRRLGQRIARVPFVQPLVFLSAAELENRLSPAGRQAVVTRDTLIRALQHGEFPGVAADHRKRPIDRPTMRELKKAFDELGLRPRKGQLKVGEYVLGAVIEDGEHYQDRLATHEHFDHLQHRARVYLVPEQTSVEHRQRLKRAAEREVQLLWSVRDQPNILTSTAYAADAPLGPTLVFEDFAEALRLDRYLQRHPELAFEARVEILRQVGHALHYCHRRNVVHGGLSPEAVLVRMRDDKVDTRLFNFQLGAGEEASATVHRSMLASHPAGAYQAPELAADPTATSPASDTFSLGALAYWLFTGQAPAGTTPDLLVRLQREGYLDPATVSDALPDPVVELVIEATRLAAHDRYDDPAEWVELLAEELREQAPAAPESTAPVLEADAGDILAERWVVRRVLGHGASARVLQVFDERVERDFALKVSRSEEHDERVRQEGQQLQRLRHPRIVQCHEIVELDDRVCLLLSLAGEQSLQNVITQQGSLDLEWAGRYGEDLLQALEALEDEAILHRDLKPANLGAGSRGKQAKHLTLFDFSLAAAPLDALDVGTAPYRDPFLPLRGMWDHHADRFSAAVTLHEMLTGLRPRWGRSGSSPLSPDAALVLEAERFDAAVRDRLIEFFGRALARDPSDRFASAREMARAWAACLAAPGVAAVARPAAGPEVDDDDEDELQPVAAPGQAQPSRRGVRVQLGTVRDEELAAIEPSTQLRALPLSSRALNALDRAGLTRAEELLGLPNNRLSAIRGIGSKVAREILELRDRWQARLGESGPAPAGSPAFVSDFTGPELYVEALPIEEDAAMALVDAGLRTTSAVARAPRSQVEAILGRARVRPDDVRRVLQAEGVAVGEKSGVPTTVDGWLAQVLQVGTKAKGDAEQLQALLGVTETGVAPTLADVAQAHGVARDKLQKTLARAIERWRQAEWAGPLRELCVGAVEKMGGVATLPEATSALRTLLGHDTDAPPQVVASRLAALFRVASELGPDPDGRRLQLRRTEHGRLDPATGEIETGASHWTLSADEDVWIGIKRLGELADELAARPVLAASGETERMLADAVTDTPIAADKIGKERLVQLAAAASRTAASSSRLELYPVGMSAERALELSAQALGGEMSEEVLRTRVTARYPEAQPLPSREAGLDDLLTRLNLRWNEARGTFVRPEASTTTSLHSVGSSLARYQTALPGQHRSRSEEAMRARDFDDVLRSVVEERKLRVWGCNPDHMRLALPALEKALGVQAIALDQRLIEKMEAYLKSRRGNTEILDKTDAAGPEGAGWQNLVKVAKEAARALAEELFPPEAPLLLMQPGLLARYELQEFLAAMIAASDEERAAIVLVNATPANARPDVVGGTLPIKGLLPGQVGELPRDWIQNRHRSATTHPVQA